MIGSAGFRTLWAWSAFSEIIEKKAIKISRVKFFIEVENCGDEFMVITCSRLNATGPFHQWNNYTNPVQLRRGSDSVVFATIFWYYEMQNCSGFQGIKPAPVQLKNYILNSNFHQPAH